jgi:hypothetical protein
LVAYAQPNPDHWIRVGACVRGTVANTYIAIAETSLRRAALSAISRLVQVSAFLLVLVIRQ